jgi:hypothetical protein
MFLESPVNQTRVADVPLYEGETGFSLSFREVLPLDPRIIVVIEIVHPHDGISATQKPFDRV